MEKSVGVGGQRKQNAPEGGKMTMIFNETKLKIESINEMIESCNKDECTCKGKMFLCTRCMMLDNLKSEKRKLGDLK